MSSSILGHVKVLDLSRVMAGPWCTQTLADLGATVWKIERPGVGDEMRQSPPFLDSPAGGPRETVPFVCLNRGKRSITIDFTRPEGREIVVELARRCDVLIENFKAGDLLRHGLDDASLRAVNPSIIYCSITGYGQDGPMAAMPGYDPVFQAVSGIMSTCGLPDGVPGGGPMRSMLPLVDVMTGMTATSAVLAALLHRDRTGEGQHIDLALLDVAVAATVHLGQRYLSTGSNPSRAGNGSLLFAPSNCFPCRDGLILIQIGNDGQWRKLCEALGRTDWLARAGWQGNADRVRDKDAVDAALAAVTREHDKQPLADLLGAAGVPSGPVNDMAAAFAHPQAQHRGMRVDLPHPQRGTLPVIRSPMRFSRTPVEHRLPPTLGEGTRAVLQGELGLDDSLLERLAAAGVV